MNSRVPITSQTIRQWIGSGVLEEVFLRGYERESGRYRLVSVASVERLKREREVRDA